MSIAVSVGGQAVFLLPSTSLISLSCLQPSLSSIVPSPGVTLGALSTLGGDLFSINGSHFGGVVGGALSVSLVNMNTGVVLPVPSCSRSPASPNSLVTCVAPAGVGARLCISLSSGGQAASSPHAPSGACSIYVSYRPPALRSVSATGASPTTGGAEFSVLGSGFGPAAFPGSAVDFALYATNVSALNVSANAVLGALAAAAAAAAGAPSSPPSNFSVSQWTSPGVYIAACRVLSDGALSCSTGPGVGTAFLLVLSVGGQTAAPVVASSLGYIAPQVSTLGGPGVDGLTVGGQQVVISGSNFGPADAYTASLLLVT